jgi:hypothetical protein
MVIIRWLAYSINFELKALSIYSLELTWIQCHVISSCYSSRRLFPLFVWVRFHTGRLKNTKERSYHNLVLVVSVFPNFTLFPFSPTFWQYNGKSKWHKVKQKSTKHYTEKEWLGNTKPTKTRSWLHLYMFPKSPHEVWLAWIKEKVGEKGNNVKLGNTDTTKTKLW